MTERQATVKRRTNETDITLAFNVDGTGKASVETGIPIFDHLLSQVARHGIFDITLTARGDDKHHLVEDIAICLGQALKMALGDKRGITRYGEATVPMDESLARVVLDLSGRSYLVYNVPMEREMIGNFATENVREFFQAVAANAGINIHIDLLRGSNTHHIIEAVFKAFARALKDAIEIEPRMEGIWSSKRVL